MPAIHFRQVNLDLDCNHDDNDPFEAGGTAGAGETEENIAHVRQGFKFVLDLMIAPAQLKQAGHIDVKAVGLRLVNARTLLIRVMEMLFRRT